MGLKTINETVEYLGEKKPLLAYEEREFVVQFAFKSGDMQLTKKLIDELACAEHGKDAIIQKFKTMIDLQPNWVEQIENLLVAIEMYRIEEEKAVDHLVDVLAAYGIDISVDEIKNTDTTVIKEKVQTERFL